MRLGKLRLLGAAAAAALIATTGAGSAAVCGGTATCTVQASGSPPFTPDNLGLATTAGYQGFGYTNYNFPPGVVSITTEGATTGVYAGTTSTAASPFPLGTTPGNSLQQYFAVQPGGTIIFTFSAPQTSIDLLWGTVDTATGYNVLLSNAGTAQTITGADIAAIAGISSGTTNTAVEITGLNSFTQLTFTDSITNSPAFEFDLGGPVNTPEPASLTLLGMGLAGIEIARRRHAKTTV